MPADHSRLRELFLAACNLSEPQQSALLDEQCAGAPELRRELLLLLRSDAREDGILADDKMADGIQLPFHTVVDPKLPKHIGRYRVKRILGEGGMGVVYLAEQQNPARDVAVKVIRSGIVSTDLLQRFELEAAVLGRLAHPGIASIYEAGVFVDETTGHERPMLAIEYIQGKPLREFVQESGSSKRACLHLLVQICEAVNHAHQRGVIHRDLKPGNVLVQSNGQPSILDFGVARVTGFAPDTSTLQTRAGELIGTLPYMSPEQVSGNTLDLDTRSDVYALGVIAYELLSGKLPYEVDDAEYLKTAKTISEDPPTPLSAMGREFRGDLNTIVLKALEKDPDRRYQSAKDLEDDIQRYLDDQPILAMPVGPVGRFWKWCQRNTAIAALLSFLAMAIILGFVATTRQTLNALHAKRQAEDSAQRTERVLDLLVNSFRSPDPTIDGHDVKMVDVLIKSAADLEQDLTEDPLLKARLLHAIGESMQALRIYDQGVRVHKSSFAIRLRELGEEHSDTLASMACLASSHKLAGEYDEAMQLSVRSTNLLTALRGEKHPETLKAKHSLALVYRAQGNRKESLKLHKQAFRLMRRTLGQAHPDTLIAMSNLGGCYVWQGEQMKALTIIEECLRLSKSHLDQQHPATLNSLGLLAVIYDTLRPVTESLPLHVEVLVSHRQLLGEDHPKTLYAMMTTARAHLRTNSETEAIRLLELAAIKMRAKLGKDRWPSIECMIYLGRAYLLAGQPNQALALLEELDLLTASPKVVQSQRLRARQFLAEALLRTGQQQRGVKILKQVLELSRMRFPNNPRAMAKALSGIAFRYLHAGMFEEAEPFLRESLDLLQAHARPGHWRQFAVQSALGESLAEQGKLEEAKSLLLPGGQGLLALKDEPPYPTPREVAAAVRRIIRFHELTGQPDPLDEWQHIAEDLRSTDEEITAEVEE